MSDSESEEDLDWAQSLDSRVLKRGEKDHAPDGTERQSSALQRSRDAMYSISNKPVMTSVKQIIECDWEPEHQRARIRKTKGKFFNTMGWAVRDITYVFPEEICYLCERGSMICYFEGNPLSIEGALSLMLHLVGAEKLSVYGHLKKSGYVVRRDTATSPNEIFTTTALSLNHDRKYLVECFWWLFGSRFHQSAWRPVYHQYSSIYRDMQAVSQKPFIKFTENKPGFDFLVWKPSTKFKRSVPTNYDFVVKVVSADSPPPSLEELENEFAKREPQLSEKRSVVTRMREGVRSMSVAVVDNGVVSFIRLGEPLLEITPL